MKYIKQFESKNIDIPKVLNEIDLPFIKDLCYEMIIPSVPGGVDSITSLEIGSKLLIDEILKDPSTFMFIKAHLFSDVYEETVTKYNVTNKGTSIDKFIKAFLGQNYYLVTKEDITTIKEHLLNIVKDIFEQAFEIEPTLYKEYKKDFINNELGINKRDFNTGLWGLKTESSAFDLSVQRFFDKLEENKYIGPRMSQKVNHFKYYNIPVDDLYEEIKIMLFLYDDSLRGYWQTYKIVHKYVKEQVKKIVIDRIVKKIEDKPDIYLQIKEMFEKRPKWNSRGTFECISDVLVKYIYFLFVKVLQKVPNYLKRSEKGGLWGLKTESHNWQSYDIFEQGTKDEIIYEIIKHIIKYPAILQFDVTGDIISSSGFMDMDFSKRINQYPPEMAIQLSSFKRRRYTKTDSPELFYKLLDVFNELKDFAVPLYFTSNGKYEKQEERLNKWLSYFNNIDDSQKSTYINYLISSQNEQGFEIPEEWLEDNNHYLRSSKGGLWGLKTESIDTNLVNQFIDYAINLKEIEDSCTDGESFCYSTMPEEFKDEYKIIFGSYYNIAEFMGSQELYLGVHLKTSEYINFKNQIRKAAEELMWNKIEQDFTLYDKLNGYISSVQGCYSGDGRWSARMNTFQYIVDSLENKPSWFNRSKNSGLLNFKQFNDPLMKEGRIGPGKKRDIKGEKADRLQRAYDRFIDMFENPDKHHNDYYTNSAYKAAKNASKTLEVPEFIEKEWQMLYFMYDRLQKRHPEQLFKDIEPWDDCLFTDFLKAVKDKIKEEITNKIKEKIKDEADYIELKGYLDHIYGGSGPGARLLKSRYAINAIVSYISTILYTLIRKNEPKTITRGRKTGMWDFRHIKESSSFIPFESSEELFKKLFMVAVNSDTIIQPVESGQFYNKDMYGTEYKIEEYTINIGERDLDKPRVAYVYLAYDTTNEYNSEYFYDAELKINGLQYQIQKWKQPEIYKIVEEAFYLLSDWRDHLDLFDESEKAKIASYLVKYKTEYKLSNDFLKEYLPQARSKKVGFWDFGKVKTFESIKQKDDMYDIIFNILTNVMINNKVDTFKWSWVFRVPRQKDVNKIEFDLTIDNRFISVVKIAQDIKSALKEHIGIEDVSYKNTNETDYNDSFTFYITLKEEYNRAKKTGLWDFKNYIQK